MVLLLSSCGLPTQDEAEVLSGEEYDDLVFGTTTSIPEETTTTQSIPEDEAPIQLYFVGEADMLERVPRQLNMTATDILGLIAEGPLEEEIEQFPDLQTFVTVDLQLVAMQTAEDKADSLIAVQVSADADLPDTINNREDEGRRIVRQIVCTLVGLDRIDKVKLIDSSGEQIGILDADSQRIEGPAQAVHFDDCKTGTQIREETAELEQNEESNPEEEN